jgi:hypothetical protein
MTYWIDGRPVEDGDYHSGSVATREVDLDEFITTHDLNIIHVDETPGAQFAVAAPAPKGAKASEVDISEIGSTSPSPWTSRFRNEYNIDLQGINGLEMYDRMRRSDGTVRGSLRLVKTPILSARWFIVPASTSTRDKNAAEFVWKNLTEMMSISFPQLLSEILLMLDYGFSPFEKVWTMDHPDALGKAVLKKLSPRHPVDILDWKNDKNGGPKAVKVPHEDVPEGRWVDIQKMLIFTFDREVGNLTGVSVLRSAYQHWYYKTQLYKIDAIQKERHGIGIPIIKLPPNFSDDDKRLAESIGRNLRTNERAHIVLPPNWDIVFAKLEGQPVDSLKSVEHHNGEIAKNILGWFLTESNPKGEEMFLKSTRYIADIICDVFNIYLIRQMIDYNFSRVGYPKLKARRIGESEDWRTYSFALRNYVGAGIVVPDDPLEAAIREDMDLPEADPETSRAVPTPQNPLDQEPDTTGNGAGQDQQTSTPAPPAPARVGPPRQSPTPPVGPPRSNAGIDRSGG